MTGAQFDMDRQVDMTDYREPDPLEFFSSVMLPLPRAETPVEAQHRDDSGNRHNLTLTPGGPKKLPEALDGLHTFVTMRATSLLDDGEACGYSEAVFVLAEEVRNFLWEQFGLNVALVAMHNNTALGWGHLTDRESNQKARKWFRKHHFEEVFPAATMGPTSSAFAPPVGDAQKFYYLEDVALLVARIHCKLIGPSRGYDPDTLGPTNPFMQGTAIHFDEMDRDPPEVVFATGPNIDDIHRFPAEGLSGKDLENLQMVQRYRDDIREASATLTQLAMLIPRAVESSPDAPGGSLNLEAFEKTQVQLVEKKSGEPISGPMKFGPGAIGYWEDALKKGTRAHKEIWKIAAQLGRKLSNDRERLLAMSRRAQTLTYKVASVKEARDELTSIPNTMFNLTEHLTPLPSSVSLEIVPDPGYEAQLRIAETTGQRPPLRVMSQLSFAVNQESGALATIQSAAEQALGKYAHYVPQILVALYYLYDMKGGYSTYRDVEVTISEIAQVMRPDSAEKIRRKGLSSLGIPLGDITVLGASVLSRIALMHPREQRKLRGKKVTEDEAFNASRLTGFISISELVSRPGGVTGKDRIVYRPNESLMKMMWGDGDEWAVAMLVDREAMFGYSKRQLHTGPALQLKLESLMRINALKSDISELTTPAGDGFTLGKLAGGIGIHQQPGQGPKKVVQRMQRGLDALCDKGVLVGWDYDGRDTSQLSDRVVIRPHSKYPEGYQLIRDQRELKDVTERLKTPFAKPRRSKRAGG